MSYLKINDIDFSMYVNELKISKEHNYNAQTNAEGDTVVDYINNKRQIKVGIISVNDEVMKNIQTVIDQFSVQLSFLNPKTNQLEDIQCIIPSNEVDYYTIQAGKTRYNEFDLKFIEL